MSEKIKIASIRLENYRQYYGSQKVEFLNRDDGFSVIVGENGAGKSNLLNAINWCFYKKEPHTTKNRGYGIINNKHLDSIKNGNVANMTIQLELQKGDDHYRISRILKVIKHKYQYLNDAANPTLRMTEVNGFPLPAGCEVIENRSTFEILIKRKDDADFHLDKTTPPEIIMNEVLPESLSSYFILDGEFLEKFWSGIHKVKTGVEQISQLHLITSAIEHLVQLKKGVPTIGIKEIDNLSARIKQYEYFENSQDSNGNTAFSEKSRYSNEPSSDTNEYYHATGRPRIKDLQEDVEKMRKSLKDIADQLGSSGITEVKELNKQQQQLRKNYERFSQNEKDYEKQYFSSLIENLPLFFLKQSIQNSIEKVDALRKKGELPYEAKKIFTNDLLERGKCICSADLASHVTDGKESNNARLEVIKVRDGMMEDQGLDSSINMKYHFEERLLGNYEKFTQSCFDEPRINFSKSKDIANKCNIELKAISLRLQNLGDVDVSKLSESLDWITKLMGDAREEIKEIEYELKENSRHKDGLNRDRLSLLNKNKKAQRIAHEQRVWDSIYKTFQQTHDELKKEIREEVQNKTMEIFLNTMYKEDQFKKFVIKDSFEVELIDQKDVSILGSLSAGESLFLALSFISAIRDVTGFKFPLVIDTPLGRVSGTPRYLLSQALPKYLPNEQIIFLATDTEFLNPDTNVHEVEGRPELAFGQLLEGQIGVAYYLIKGMEKNTARIVDYKPKWRTG